MRGTKCTYIINRVQFYANPCTHRRQERQRQSVCVLTSHFIRLISPISPMKILRSVPPYLSVLRVSPKAIARAFKSFHSLLTLNTEYGGQGRIVQAIIYNNPQNLRASLPLYPPCFAEGHSGSI